MRAMIVNAIGVGLLLSGCTTSLTHEKLELGKQPTSPGIGYFLPKQRYVISSSYELKSCPNANGTAVEQAAPLIIKQSASLTESPAADVSEYYSIPIDTLTSGWKTTSLTVTLYENGTLHTVGATVDDQSATVVAGVVSTAASVARIVIGAPTSALTGKKPALCTDEVYRALAVVKESQSKFLSPDLDDKARANWAAAVMAAKATLTINATFVFEPTRDKPSMVGQPQKAQILGWLAHPELMAATQDEEKKAYARSLKTGVEVKDFPASVVEPATSLTGYGVLYREAVPVRLRICSGPCGDAESPELAQIHSTAAQFGRHVVLPLKNRPFEKNNLALSLSPSGVVETMTYGTESRFTKMATALAGAGTAFEDVASKKRAADKAADADAAGAEIKTIKAQTDLINARSDRIEAEQRLIKLEGVPE